jgi:Holliday junction resolvase RusA-like endonuclease
MNFRGEPRSTQHIYGQRGRRRYMTADAKAIKEAYQWEAKSQWKFPPIAGHVSLTIRYYLKKKIDLDNTQKLLLDAFSGIVYRDDDQIGALHLFKSLDAGNPRIEVTVH